MTTRRTTNNPRRDDPKPRSGKNGKGGSLITGLFIGLVAGLVVAAGLAWYFINRTPAFQSTETIVPTHSKRDTPSIGKNTPDAAATPAEPSSKVVPLESVSSPSKPRGTQPAQERTAPPTPATDAATNTMKPRVDYTFYGILPGDKPAKPIAPPRSKDIWWLQVAALKNPGDADKLKARLALLGLDVATQRVESEGGIALYRVRVGPYKREDDALGDLDTLAAHDFEPRLFKEPNTPPAVTNNKEKP